MGRNKCVLKNVKLETLDVLNYNENNSMGMNMGMQNQIYNQGEMQMNHYSQMNNNNIIIQNQNNFPDFNYLNYKK